MSQLHCVLLPPPLVLWLVLSVTLLVPCLRPLLLLLLIHSYSTVVGGASVGEEERGEGSSQDKKTNNMTTDLQRCVPSAMMPMVFTVFFFLEEARTAGASIARLVLLASLWSGYFLIYAVGGRQSPSR